MIKEGTYNKNVVVVIAAVAATGGLLFGFDTGVISGAIPFFQQNFQLSNSMIENITTAGLIGAVIGAAFTGRLSDIFGRKKTILTAAEYLLLVPPGRDGLPMHIYLCTPVCSSAWLSEYPLFLFLCILLKFHLQKSGAGWFLFFNFLLPSASWYLTSVTWFLPITTMWNHGVLCCMPELYRD